MCGFAVAVGAWAGDAQTRVAAVTAALHGRGPDGQAVHCEPELTMVAARLTHWEEGLSDLPYVDPASGTAAVFNGELFNLPELRARVGLPAGSEIEVLTAGLRTFGPDFLRDIDGQFAAVVRIGPNGPTYAVRDRFGVCPLYWSPVSDGVALASNLAALLALTGMNAEVDDEGVRSILTQWAPTGERAPLAGVRQVGPGRMIVIDDDEPIRTTPWTQDARPAAPAGTAVGDALDDLERRLRDSVRDRLRSTRPVACLLSGGIDSTVIGAIAADLGVRRALALSLEGDEATARRQRQVADALGMELIQHVLTPADTVAELERYVGDQLVPLVRLGPVGMAALSGRAEAEGIPGVLSGEGADELFCGYDSHRILAARGGAFGPVESLDWSAFGAPEFGADRSATWQRAYWRSIVTTPGAGSRRSDILRTVEPLFAPGLLDRPSGSGSGSEPVAAATVEDRRRDDLADLLGAYLLTVQGDHAWMEHGVELRPPYLAKEVADWALSRPGTDFISIRTGKTPIRALLQRLILARPALAELDVPKAAFRVDAAFVLRDDAAFGRLLELAAACPSDLMNVEAVLDRGDRCRRSGRISEAESMALTFAASLGILATRPDAPERRADSEGHRDVA